MNPAHLEASIDRYFDGGLSADELQELSVLLKTDSTARDCYWRLAKTHAALRGWGASQAGLRQILAADSATPLMGEGLPTVGLPTVGLSKKSDIGSTDEAAPAINLPESAPPVRSPVLGFLGGVIDYVNHSRTVMFWLVAALVGSWFAVQLGSLILGRAHPGGVPVAGQPAAPDGPAVPHQPGSPSAIPGWPQGGPVASISALVDCHWRAVSPAAPAASATGDVETTGPIQDNLYQVGSELSVGQQLDLVRGLAEITFNSGARIVLNGPAHFVVGSKSAGKLQVGKLTARVPHEAHGFTVNTPAGKVVDLGTEFGVAVAADHTMAVEVFVGQVAVDSSADGQTPKPSEKVEAGQAVRVVPGKPVVSIPLDPKRFVRGLGPREDSHVAQAAYLDFLRSLKPVVWFRMEGQDADRVLHDEMGGPDAKLYWVGPGSPFVQGRVGKSLWLRGAQLKEGALLSDYPKAEHGKLSVAAWVYAESANNWNSIVKNWSSGLGDGQFHFGIYSTHKDLSVYIAQSDGKYALAREGAAHPFPLNQWQHVAFTTDGSTLRLYRQGREVASAKHVGLLYPGKIAALGIGLKTDETGAAKSTTSPSYWDGKLDEIAIFNETLSAEDIKKLADNAPL